MKCRRVTDDGLSPGELGRGRIPANAYLMSRAEIFAFGNSAATERTRYSISCDDGLARPGFPLSGTSVVPTSTWSFYGKTKTGRPSLASVYRAALGAPEKRGSTM